MISTVPTLPPAPFRMPNSYYLKLVTSEYQGPAPNMLDWLFYNLQYIADVTNAAAQLMAAMNLLDTVNCVGAQLDLIGIYIGQPRLIGFQPTGLSSVAPGGGTTAGSAGTGYQVGDVVTVVQVGATGGTVQVLTIGSGGSVISIKVVNPGNGYQFTDTVLNTTGGHGTGFTVVIVATISPVLDDTTYRQLLQCRIFQNHWDGQIASLGPFWQTVFPGGIIHITDHGSDGNLSVPPYNATNVMNATVNLGGNLNSITVDLIQQGYIVPRPQGVNYNYQLSAANLPTLGFDQNTAYVAGFNLGHFL